MRKVGAKPADKYPPLTPKPRFQAIVRLHHFVADKQHARPVNRHLIQRK
jgi:hypothetical protein